MVITYSLLNVKQQSINISYTDVLHKTFVSE